MLNVNKYSFRMEQNFGDLFLKATLSVWKRISDPPCYETSKMYSFPCTIQNNIGSYQLFQLCAKGGHRPRAF
jgi:hypothetical protein